MLKDLAEVVGCGVGKLLFTYLGFPMGRSPKRAMLPCCGKGGEEISNVEKELLVFGGKVYSYQIPQFIICHCLRY